MVQSNRIQSVRQVGDRKEFEYGQQPVAVRISDQGAVGQRKGLFVEMTRLDEVHGPQFEKERLITRAIKEAQKAIGRLTKVKTKPDLPVSPPLVPAQRSLFSTVDQGGG